MMILIVYGSTTGNTHTVAEMIAERLSDHDCVVSSASDIDTPLDFDEYDVVLFGSSTWGDGDMQESMQPIVEAFTPEVCANLPTAVFGCCDSAFPSFGRAVDVLTQKLHENEAEVLIPSLKIDGFPQDQEPRIQEWIDSLIASFKTLEEYHESYSEEDGTLEQDDK